MPGGPSLGYCCYRVCLALAMVTGIALHFASTLDTLGGKWPIYMTNQEYHAKQNRIRLVDLNKQQHLVTACLP